MWLAHEWFSHPADLDHDDGGLAEVVKPRFTVVGVAHRGSAKLALVQGAEVALVGRRRRLLRIRDRATVPRRVGLRVVGQARACDKQGIYDTQENIPETASPYEPVR